MEPLASRNDPYNAFEINKKNFTDVGAEIIVMHNGGHITADDGFTEIPETLEEFKKMTQ
ncbi:MAG: hypothetical protein AMXMBFR44_4410 [Candidatus Campbellbacteria bacterium]